MIEAGSNAPAFTLESTAGPATLGDYAGRMLVLYFYPKDDTSGCTAQAQQFSALAGAFAAAGAAILGVSKDNLAKHAKVIEKYSLAIPLASDPEGETIAAYGCWVEKRMYGRKYMGIERATFLISSTGNIRAVWRKVKVTGHAEAVLKQVQSAG